MGGGSYSLQSRQLRANDSGYHTKSANEIFARSFESAMNPKGVTLRESRDSEEHPNSVPIIVALDVTGSMGRVPHTFIKDGLPTLMSTIIEAGISDPQLLFMGIGDHKCDTAPLQIGQFESSDELLDQWLEKLWLEGHGGGNGGESYSLAWFFASRYVETDHWDKRQKKGYLFTIGDERNHSTLDASAIQRIMGQGDLSNVPSAQLLADAMERWHVYHFHLNETYSGRDSHTLEEWTEILGGNVIAIDNHKDIPREIARLILLDEGKIHAPVGESESGEAESKDEDLDMFVK